MNWFRFFFGTPQHLLRTVIVGLVILAIASPTTVATAVNRTSGALFGPIVTIVLLGLILRMVFGGGRRK